MSRDSGSEHPSQRTVAELLAEYGGASPQNARRRRRRAEDPSETAPQAIIERVNSDSGRMRPVHPDDQPPQHRNHRHGGGGTHQPPTAPPPPVAAPAPPPSSAPSDVAAASTETDQAGDAPTNDGAQGFWARRFTGAQSGAPEAGVASGDLEATVQQPVVPSPLQQPQPTPPGSAQIEPETEQFPPVRVERQDQVPNREPDTTLLAYPQDTEHAHAPESHYEDPYDYGSYSAEGFEAEDDGPAPPAELEAEDYRTEEPDEDAEGSTAREWLVWTAQVGVALVAGGAAWEAFHWLWMSIPVAALVAAVVVTGCLVLIARKLRRTDDLQTVLLSVLVGLICTVSPAALLLLVNH
jgi:hypothetical protein